MVEERVESTPTEAPRYVPPKLDGLGTIRPLDLLIAVGCGAAALAVYLRTLAASIAWGDSPELTAAAFQAGVPHPTGYPLYMLLAHAWITLLPIGSVAQRMNALSAVSGAAGVAVLYLFARRVVRIRVVAAAGALLFAFSLTFWSQCVIAEVYAFQILVSTLVLLCVVQWDYSGSPRWLAGAALAYGLCFTHHMMSVLLAPGLLYFALTSPRRAQFARALPWTVPLFLCPLLLYAYLPLAALRDPGANWGDPRTPGNFLFHLTGGVYQGRMFHQSLGAVWRNLVRYAGPDTGRDTALLLTQWGPVPPVLALLGAGSLARLRPRLFGLTLAVYLCVVVYAVNYNISDIEVYYIPAHLITAVWIGCGLRQAGAWVLGPRRRLRSRRWVPALSVALLGLPALPLCANWGANDLHRDQSALSYAHALFDALPPRAVLLAGGDREYFPLIYAHYVEKRRPDVTLVTRGALGIPRYHRLITRMRREGLVVNVPPPGVPPGTPSAVKPSFGRQLFLDNIRSRPIFAAGDDLLLDSSLRAAGFPTFRATSLPLREVRMTAPAWERPRALPALRAGTVFTDPGPTHGRVLRIEGWEAETHRHGDVLWLRVRYDWQVFQPEIARRLRISAWFGDAQGRFDRLDSGEAAMANLHDFGQGAQFSSPPPSRVRETFEVPVPPSQRDRVLHLWLSVREGDRTLAADGRAGAQVDLGPLPDLR